jgi:hypothetical protein
VRAFASLVAGLVAVLCLPGGARAVDISRALYELGAPRPAFRLTTTQAEYTLKLPVSPREIVTGATLRLATTNSTALIRSRSELTVRLNGRPLAQFPLDPEKTQHTRELKLPVDALKPGYNDLSFAVVQHYTYDCEDPAAPELWTEVDTVHSAVTFEVGGVRPNNAPRLTQLHVVFDERGWLPRSVAFVTGTDRVKEGQLAAAALVAQGIALRYRHRPAHLAFVAAASAHAARGATAQLPGLAAQLFEGQDVVLVGTRAELARFLDATTLGSIGGPTLALLPGPDGVSMALVVSGLTEPEVMTAARAFADPTFQLLDAPAAAIARAIDFEAWPRARPGKRTPFASLRYRTASTRGLHAPAIDFELRTPSDYSHDPGDAAVLRLHFSYGAGLRKDSALNIRVNGEFVGAVPLNDERGAELDSYEVRLPARMLWPGFNRISFEPVFLANKGRCQMVRDENLVLTLYEDSTVELPPDRAAPRLPDLARTVHGLYPFDRQLHIFAMSPDVSTVSAVLGLSGLLAQRNRSPLDVTVDYYLPPVGHVLAVGPYEALPSALQAASPLNEYTWRAEGAHAVVAQFVYETRSVTLVSGRSAPQTARVLTSLWDKGLWSGMEGEAAVIDTDEHAMSIRPAARTVQVQRPSSWAARVNDWQTLAATAAGTALLFSFAFVALLRRKATERIRSAGRPRHAPDS